MLLLRKACQPLLDGAGLKDLHVGVSPHGQRALSLVGKCGQTLVVIGGIAFSKNTITNKEREYATELFAKFLKQHAEVLSEYIKEKKAFSLLELPVLPKRKGVLVSGQQVTIQANDTTIRISPTSFSVSSTKNLVILSGILTKHEDTIKEIEGFHRDFKKYYDKQSELNIKLNTITTCDI